MEHQRRETHHGARDGPLLGLKGGCVRLPRWVLFLRALQLLFAVIIIGLVSYSLSIHDGSYVKPPSSTNTPSAPPPHHPPSFFPTVFNSSSKQTYAELEKRVTDGTQIRPALIPTLIIAILTIIPILSLTTVLAPSLRGFHDARAALLADGTATLFWLASFTALACYERIYYNAYDIGDYYRRKRNLVYDKYSGYARYEDVHYMKAKRVWKTGAAAAWFGGIEFLLFSITTLVFVYCYHHYLAGTSAPGLGSRGAGDAEALPRSAAPGIAAPATVPAGTATAPHSAPRAAPEQETVVMETVPESTKEESESANSPHPVQPPSPDQERC
ncbi:hypothetical protein W97_05896 [Coniosporium apollinis CBS 100218]|uniref:MARVEL domain-containing protein n=1 Tax=Coniosporium apollinis (strain CBS 100218) TaxID=1168221 RepID=R7YXJ7_CONA1|nr:uncharacterized protein W97_05896 [Coniosporium apollinis CBS 100218]EON66650.1 hypothetical protein W97_05896 [Coniosporium apollinis CBS 100218]